MAVTFFFEVVGEGKADEAIRTTYLNSSFTLKFKVLELTPLSHLLVLR